jgi:hypothetical protein
MSPFVLRRWLRLSIAIVTLLGRDGGESEGRRGRVSYSDIVITTKKAMD